MKHFGPKQRTDENGMIDALEDPQAFLETLRKMREKRKRNEEEITLRHRESHLKNFKEDLSERIVEFTYKKKDGTIREAKGTTNPDIISKYVEPTSSDKPKRDIKVSESSIRYFDIDKEGWRSCVIDNLIKFIHLDIDEIETIKCEIYFT